MCKSVMKCTCLVIVCLLQKTFNTFLCFVRLSSPPCLQQDFYSQSTWVELERDGVLQGFGLPGADLGEVAGPNDLTCTNCESTTVRCALIF